MSKASKDYKKIISGLESLKVRCKDGIGIEEQDIENLREAMDIISDYEKAVTTLSRMQQHYESQDRPIQKSGVWCCPACGKRIQYNHNHCHWCGKRAGWRAGWR